MRRLFVAADRWAEPHTIVDVQGYFLPAASATGGGNLLTVVAPQRLVDTRTDNYCLPNGTCTKKGPVPLVRDMRTE